MTGVTSAAVAQARVSTTTMSLKGFHLFFIAVSVVMSLFVFAWAIRRFMSTEESAGLLVLAGVCLAAAIALALYGVQVRRKLAHLGEPQTQPRLVD